LRVRIAQLVSGVWVVIARQRKTCVCAVQMYFHGSAKQRSYVIVHKPGNRYAGGRWWAKTFAGPAAHGGTEKARTLDLRDRADARELAALLENLDPREWA